MRMTLVTFLLAYLSGCAHASSDRAAGESPRRYMLAGAVVESPRGTAWQLLAATHEDVAFQAHAAHVTTSLTARSFPIARFVDDPAFLAFAESRQKETVRSLEMVSVHYNRKRFKEAACLQYDGIFRDTAVSDTDQRFLNMKGLLCRHPTNSLLGVQVELRVRSAAKTPDDMEQILVVATRFFDGATFTTQ